jgi:hypothetical protein
MESENEKIMVTVTAFEEYSEIDKKDFIALIEKEYFQLQDIIETFDARALEIKKWSVTTITAAIVSAYLQTQPVVLIIAAISALAFWLVEALWKVNQQAFYARIYEIENAMARRGEVDLAPLQIASAWSRSWHAGLRERKLLRVLRWPHVYLPHVPVALGSALLFFFIPPTH